MEQAGWLDVGRRRPRFISVRAVQLEVHANRVLVPWLVMIM